MAAWVEATTREVGQSLINPDKPSISASAIPEDMPKPALGPKPHLMPKPFTLQRNATVRPIRAPRTNFSRQLNRAASSETLLTTSEETHPGGPKTSVSNGTVNGSNQSAAPKPIPLSPTPDLNIKPKPDPTKSPVPTGPSVTNEDVRPRSRAKSLGSQDQKFPNQKAQEEADETEAEVKVSRCWPARNRLSAELTSKFEVPSQSENTVRKDGETNKEEKERPPQSPSAVFESKPPVETGDEEFIGGSIKRRISLLFDRSAASQRRETFNKRDVTAAEISVDIKQRIQNLSLDAPRTRLPSTGAPISPPSEKKQSTSDEPENEISSEKPAESTTEKASADKPSSIIEIKNSAANVEKVEEEDDEKDNKNYVAMPLYRRVGVGTNAEMKKREEEEKKRKEEMLEKERQQRERERLLEEERKAMEIERQRNEERKQEEERQRQMEERRKQDEECKRKLEEERREEERRRQMEEEKRKIEEEKERQREEERLRQEKLEKERKMEEMERQKEEERLRKEEMERLRKERETEEEKRRIQELERQKEEERLRKEREMERIKKEKEMEEEKRRIQELERQKEEERLRKEREMERIKKEKEMAEEKRRIQEMERQKEQERLRKEREMERIRKEREMEEERLRQEREKERLKKEKEMEEERRRIQEMERQKEEERLKKEQEMERIRKEREMEERKIEEERLRQEREKERLKKEKEMEEERRRIQELERQKEEERLRKEQEMERIRKEKEMEEERKRIQELERQKEEERLRKEREMERIRKEKEMEEERKQLQELERQKQEERLRKEREMERLRKEKEVEEERKRIQELERQKEEERLRKDQEMERKRKEREMEEERRRIKELERQKEEERLRKEREMERIMKEREIEKRKSIEEERRREEERSRQERETERLKKEKEMEEERQRLQEMERQKDEERRRWEREIEMETCEAAERLRVEVPTSYDLISFDAEEPAASQTLVSPIQTVDEVLYDDFSVRPQRWGTRARRSSTPSPSRESPVHNLQPEPTSSIGSQAPCGGQVYVDDLIKFEPQTSSPKISSYKDTESRKESEEENEIPKQEDLLEPETDTNEGELEDGEPEEDGVAEPDEENLIEESSEQSENNDTVDDAAESRLNQALQRLTQVRRRKASSDSDAPDVSVHHKPEPLPVLQSSAPPLDSSLLRSKVDLGKKRSIKRTRPSRAVRQRAALPALTEGTNPDWRFCDSTDAKDPCSNGGDSESEEEPSQDATSSPAPSHPKRVPLFPGMDPSALMAQLKRRSGVVEVDSPEAQVPPSVPVRSPRTPTMSLGPRVLPPVDAKDSGSGSSPAWLLELKSKKRMSQPDSDA